MNKNLIEDFKINCLRHGEFKVSSAIYEKKEENKISNICPKCLNEKKNRFKNYSPLKWV